MRNSGIFRSILFTLVVTSIFSVTPAFADKLELTNGKIYEGKVISVGSKQVILKNDKGKLLFSKNKVSKIIFEDEVKESVSKKSEPKKAAKKEVAKKAESTKVSKKDSTKKAEPKKTTKKEVAQKEMPKKEVKKETKESKQTTKTKKTEIAKTKKAERKPALKSKRVIEEKPVQKAEVKKVENTKPVIKKAEPVKEVKAAHVEEKPVTKTVQTMPYMKKLATNLPETRPVVDFITFINGSQSNNLYFGIYSNDLKNDNLTVFLPDQTPGNLSFKVHAQQNGQVAPLFSAASVVFVMKDGSITKPTPPEEVGKTSYHEWFSNLENIAGVSGEKNISLQIPKGAVAAVILGSRPGSSNNLVGYISNVKLDGKPVTRMISN